jgi:hypothetical protein
MERGAVVPIDIKRGVEREVNKSKREPLDKENKQRRLTEALVACLGALPIFFLWVDTSYKFKKVRTEK